jgi:hypothetical protein
VSPKPAEPPIRFEVNQGQADSSVLFLGSGDGYELSLSAGAMTLAIAQTQAGPSAPLASLPGAGAQGAPAIDVLQMRFVGASPSVQAVGLDRLPGTVNYLIGANPNQWHTDIPTFSSVELKGVYPGIDLVDYGNADTGQLEYDWLVAPGADPGAIRLAFQGADEVQVSPDGVLLLPLAGGTVTEHAPAIYQTIAGARQTVAGRYVSEPDGTIGLAVGAYNRSLPLTIDPIVTYSTLLGGSGADAAFGVAGDAAGDAYITGYTLSPGLATSSAAQTEPGGGFDAFVTKFSPDGTTALYTTYLGGAGLDVGNAITVDASGCAYVAGYTNSTNFPTWHAYQAKNAGGTDAFVAKLAPAGNSLLYSTYLGGSGSDQALGIAVDGNGDAFITGTTSSKNFPPVNSLKGAALKGSSAAFVVELNAAGSKPIYSTLLGGSSGNGGTAIAVDGAGNAYVTGYTSSNDFPPRRPPSRPSAAGSMRS